MVQSLSSAPFSSAATRLGNVRAFGLSVRRALTGMDSENLDDGVREQLGRQLGHPLLFDRLGQLYFEPFALADAGHLPEAEASAGAGDRLTLGVVYLAFQHHVDHESRHMLHSTRARSTSAGGDPGRPAVAWKVAAVTRLVACVTIGTLWLATLDRSRRGDSTVTSRVGRRDGPGLALDLTRRCKEWQRGRQRCRTRRPLCSSGCCP